MLLPTEREVLEKLTTKSSLVNEVIEIYTLVSPKVGPNKSHDLGSSRTGLIPICALLAAERSNSDEVTTQSARTASCLNEKDFRTAREMIERALLVAKDRASHREQPLDWKILSQKFNIGENVKISFKEMAHQVGATQQYALFRWVALAAEAVSVEEIDNYLSEQGQRLDPIKCVCAMLDKEFCHKKDEILRSQRIEEKRKANPSNNSPSRRQDPRGHSRGTPSNLNTPKQLTQSLRDLNMKSSSRKRAAETAMEVDSSPFRVHELPSKRAKLSDPGKSGNLFAPPQSSNASAPLGPTLRPLQQERPNVLPARKALKSSSPKSSPPKASTHLFCSDTEDPLENRTVSPKNMNGRQIPLCGLRRELFLDRKAWHTLDSRMAKHLEKFPPL